MALARAPRRPARPALLTVLQKTDARWSNAIYLQGVAMPRLLWKVYEFSGDGFVWLALIATAFFGAEQVQGQRTLALNFFVGWVLDLILVGSVKALVRRSRPVYNHVEDFIVVVAVDRHSFPSGHAARASFVAQFAAACLADAHPWLCVAAAAWAVTTALSRVAMGRHYFFDVCAGLLLGVGTMGILSSGGFHRSTLLISEQQGAEIQHQVWQLLDRLRSTAGPILIR